MPVGRARQRLMLLSQVLPKVVVVLEEEELVVVVSRKASPSHPPLLLLLLFLLPPGMLMAGVGQLHHLLLTTIVGQAPKGVVDRTIIRAAVVGVRPEVVDAAEAAVCGA